MRCPSCGHENSKVLDSRSIEDNTVMKRRRCCQACDFRFTTHEKVEAMPLIVIKNNGKRELFSQEKILKGLSYACQKRPVSLEQLERIALETENYLKNLSIYEIESHKIGEFVIDRLKELDEIAYVRFASVYREFKDINSFIQEIETLTDRDK